MAIYDNAYGSDEALDPNVQRRQAILNLMGDTAPPRTISPTTLPSLLQAHASPQDVAGGEMPEAAAAAPNPYSSGPSNAGATGAMTRPADNGLQSGGQILDLYSNPYARRGGGTGGAGSGALSGAGTGATIGSVIPGVGTAIGAGVGALVGGITGAIRKHAASAPTDFAVDDARKIIKDSYRDMFGREATDEEVNGALAGQGLKPGDRYVGEQGLQGVLGHLAENAAAERSAAANGAATAGPATPDTTPAPGASAASATGAAAGTGNGGGGMPGTLEGFDAGKFSDPNKHDTKYDFARIAAQYQPTPAGLDQAWNAIKQQFPNATRIGKDAIDFGDGNGPVDVIRAAGEGGKAWHFEPADDGSGGAATSASPANAGLGMMPGAAQLAAPLTNNNVMQQIMDEVRRIQSGQPPRNAILNQLGL
jgi:hypothetical protein